MNAGPSSVLTQVVRSHSSRAVQSCIALHPMPRSSRGMTARDQFFSRWPSLRSLSGRAFGTIEACLGGLPPSFTQWAFAGTSLRTNLAYANEHRDWARLRSARTSSHSQGAATPITDDSDRLESPRDGFYAVDSTTIRPLPVDVSLGALSNHQGCESKLHTQIDMTGPIPVFIRILGRVRSPIVHFPRPDRFRTGRPSMSSIVATSNFARLSTSTKPGHTCDSSQEQHPVLRFWESQSGRTRKPACAATRPSGCAQPKGKLDYPKRLRRISCFDTVTGNEARLP